MITYDKQNSMSFLSKTQNTILSAAFVIAASSGLNAVLGLLKNRMLAASFGVSNDLAVFYTADRIPNLIYSVLVIGAVSTIFIPIFTEKLRKDKKAAFETASSIINTVFTFFLFLSTLMFIFSKQIINALAIGKFTPEEVALGASLMSWMLISQMILVAGSLISSLLQSFKYFLLPALAPLAYNVGMLAGIYFLSPKFGIYGPTYGTIIGALLHLAIQIPLVHKTGFRPNLNIAFDDKGLMDVIKLVPPRILSVLIANSLAIANNSLAILISTSSVVYLKFALQLQTFPVNLFGASIATASLPTLSEENGDTAKNQFKKTFLTSFHQMMFLVIPSSVLLLILRVPVVRLVYGVENFPWEATLSTAKVLGFFSLSIFSQSAIYLITRAFYALKDTKTPVKVSLISLFLNIGLSLLFILVLHLDIWAVAASYAVTSLFDMAFMFYLLHLKLGKFSAKAVFKPFAKIAISAFLMGVTLYLPIKILDYRIFDTTRTINLLLLTAIATVCGGTTYLAFTHIFHVYEVELLYKMIKKLNLKTRVYNIEREDVVA